MAELLKTPLYDLHRSLSAKMVPFAGYEMPVQYPSGVMSEHLHTRKAAGIFDVSHMGQVIIRAKDGRYDSAALALETIIPMNILGLKENRQRYAFFTNNIGGIMDDLMVANRGDHLFLVVNAACKDQDIAHLRTHLSDSCHIETIQDRALIAIQGPKAEAAVATLSRDVIKMKFMDVATITLAGVKCWISRSGYTGEDGYEISIPADQANNITSLLLKINNVKAIGLGARDSLRLEAGLCLYGNDIDTKTTPIEAGLIWAIQKTRRTDGDRAGGFPGADIILRQIENGVAKKRVGISPKGRAPMRAGTKLFVNETSDVLIGTITSGGFGPSVNAPISMGYIKREHAEIGTDIFAEVRGKRLPASLVSLPFIPANFKR